MGYSKAPKQPQSSARPIYHSLAMTITGREPATIRIVAYIGTRRAAHYTTGDDGCMTYIISGCLLRLQTVIL